MHTGPPPNRLEKDRANLAIYEEGHTRYPPGVKPHRFPASFIELHEDWDDTACSDATLTIVIPKGSTKCEAIRRIHQKAWAYMTKIAIEAQERKQAFAAVNVRRAEFTALVEKMPQKKPLTPRSWMSQRLIRGLLTEIS